MASIEDLVVYTLPRDQLESRRLNQQHEVYKLALGYILHPTLAASMPQNAHIADVATGTGVWLLDLASSLSNTYTFTGLDLSDAQFPETKSENISFKTLNILESPPAEFQSKFDLINLRLLICGLTKQDWKIAARNLLLLLKPGGWLQWVEGDFSHMDVLQSKPAISIKALKKVFHYVIDEHQKQGKMGYDDVRSLLSLVQGCGYVDCMEDIVSSDRVPEGRAEGSVIGSGAICSLARNMAKRGESRVGEIEELCNAAESETKEGAYWRWNIHTIIARKPLQD